MKTNHWKRTIAGLLAMSTLFSLSFTAVSAEETTAETTAAATTTTTATTVVEIPETDMPTLSVTEEEAALQGGRRICQGLIRFRLQGHRYRRCHSGHPD